MCAGKLAKSYARDRPNRQAREARKIFHWSKAPTLSCPERIVLSEKIAGGGGVSRCPRGFAIDSREPAVILAAMA
jgi:hypothetical protein